MTVPFQHLLQDAQSRGFAPFLGDVGFSDVTLEVDNTPQVLRRRMIRGILPKTSHSPLMLAMPSVGGNTSSTCQRHCRAPYPARLLAPDIRRKQRTKAVPPEARRLVADVDATFKQQVHDVAQRQREAGA